MPAWMKNANGVAPNSHESSERIGAPVAGQVPSQHSASVGNGAGGTSAWVQHKAPNGKVYYHNKQTGKSSWEKPMVRDRSL